GVVSQPVLEDVAFELIIGPLNFDRFPCEPFYVVSQGFIFPLEDVAEGGHGFGLALPRREVR
ncbi:hypothetical protein A2U01_0102957, partial [Trifolium medium]|nr:hypothetical protein [Trifolium medium]